MKKYLAITLIIVSTRAISQTEISIDVEGKRINDAQTFSIGDSLFVALDWFDQSETLKLKRGYWINTLGEVTSYEFGFVSRLMLCGVERTSSNGHYYYFIDFSKKKKHTASIGIYYSEKNQARNIRRQVDEIEVAGEYLGADFSNGAMNVFFFDQGENLVRCQTMSEGKAKSQSVVQLPFKLKSDICFISKLNQVPFSAGKAKNKIYFDSGRLILLSDESKLETIVFQTNLETKKSNSFRIPSDSRNSVIKDNSFMYDNTIYKLTVPNNQIKFSVFELGSGAEIYSKELSKLDGFGAIDVYQQVGFTTFRGRSLKSLLAPNGTSSRFMIVDPFSSSNLSPLVVFGSYLETKGSTPFLLNPYNLAGSIAASLVANAIWQSAGREYAVAKYAYLNGSSTENFTLVAEFKDPRPTRQIIDDYEIKQGQLKLDYALKTYQTTAHGVFGIYQVKKEKKIRLVRF